MASTLSFDDWFARTRAMPENEGVPDYAITQYYIDNILRAPAKNEAPAPTERTWGEALADTGAGLMRGGARVVETIGDLGQLVTGSQERNALQEVGGDAAEYWQGQKSDILQQKEQGLAQRMSEAGKEGLGAQLWAGIYETARDPALLANFIAENAGLMVPGAGAGRIAGFGARALGAGAKAAGTAATGAAIGTGAALQGADVGSDTLESLKSLPAAVWRENPDFQALVKSGLSEQEAADEISMGLARRSGAAGAAASVVSQFIVPGGAGKTIERVLAGAAGKPISQGGMREIAKQAARAFFGEGTQEAVEEGAGKFGSNLAVSEVDPQQSLTEGVGTAAGQGFVLGAGLGAPAGVAEGMQNNATFKQAEEIRRLREASDKIAAAKTGDEMRAAAAEVLLKDIQSPALPAPTTVMSETETGLTPNMVATAEGIRPERPADLVGLPDERIATARFETPAGAADAAGVLNRVPEVGTTVPETGSSLRSEQGVLTEAASVAGSAAPYQSAMTKTGAFKVERTDPVAAQSDSQLLAQTVNATIANDIADLRASGDAKDAAEADRLEALGQFTANAAPHEMVKGGSTAVGWGRFFGTEVRFFTSDSKLSVNGAAVTTPDGRNIIFLNARAKSPVMEVFGHEITHIFERDAKAAGRPELYTEFVEAMRPFLPEGSIGRTASKYGALGDATKESVADLSGSVWTNESFYEKLAQEKPDVFRRVVDAVKKFIAAFRASIADGTVPIMKEAVADIDKVEAIVAKFTAKHQDLLASGAVAAGKAKRAADARMRSDAETYAHRQANEGPAEDRAREMYADALVAAANTGVLPRDAEETEMSLYGRALSTEERENIRAQARSPEARAAREEARRRQEQAIAEHHAARQPRNDDGTFALGAPVQKSTLSTEREQAANRGQLRGEYAANQALADRADKARAPLADRLKSGGWAVGANFSIPDMYGENAGTDLEGLPSEVEVDGETVSFHGWAPAQQAAREYMEDAGLEYSPPRQYVKVDKKQAKRIADAYERAEHNPKDPEVKAAYAALIKETVAQYEAILRTGLKVEFIPEGAADPYGNPRNAIIDIVRNNHFWVYSTKAGYGSEGAAAADGHPMLAETKHEISGETALANDIFRVVHDYFGHVKEGIGFRADGEENAWRAHAAMYSDKARRAMTTETRGQNSWVNFGPKGEQNRTAKGNDTTYADQKAALLPEWISEIGVRDAKPEGGAATAETFTLENIEQITKRDGWAILTAENPNNAEASDAENVKLTEKLRERLKADGIEYIEVRGKYSEGERPEERSFIVFADKRRAMALGIEFGQESILTREGLVYQSGKVDKATGKVNVFETVPENYYTRIPGEAWAFSVDIDFSVAAKDDSADYVPPKRKKRSEAPNERSRFADEPGTIIDKKTISTRYATKPTIQEADPDIEPMHVGLKAALRGGLKEGLARSIRAFQTFRVDRRLSDEKLIESFVEHLKGNLIWLYEKVPAETRERTRQWYVGANKYANSLAKAYGVTDMQAAAVISRLSPQNDWFNNIWQAREVISFFKDDIRRAHRWDLKMEQKARGLFTQTGARVVSDAIISNLRGKSFNQLSDDVEAAWFLRIYSETYSDRTLHRMTPDGEIAGVALNDDGTEQTAHWNSSRDIALSLRMLRDGSHGSISASMGEKHKIRNFYNNIISPNDEYKNHVTIDTHAVAAAHLMPFSSEALEVKQAFGGSSPGLPVSGASGITGVVGTYPLYHEAYVRAAKQLGVLPRELQSITWEEVRELFHPDIKDRMYGAVAANWTQYVSGKITEEQARDGIWETADEFTRGKRSDQRVAEGEQSGADAGELGGGELGQGRGAVDARGEGRGAGQVREGTVDDDIPFSLAGLAEPAVRPGREGSVSALGVHFSNAPGLPALSGSAFGRGIRGAEQERLSRATDPRIKRRVYFYVMKPGQFDPKRREHGLGTHTYRADLGNLYESGVSPPVEYERAFINKEFGIRDEAENANRWESALLDAGYDGYLIRKPDVAVVLNKDVPVKYLGQLGGPKIELSLASDNEQQAADLDRIAKERGHAGIDEFVREDFAGFMEEAKTWRDRNPRVALSLATPAIKRWMGGSKLVYGNGAPHLGYHGTLGDITEFNPELLRSESYFGNAVYLTNNPHDASNNYASVAGGDVRARREAVTDEVQQEIEWTRDPETGELIDPDTAEDEIERQVTERLKITNDGNVMPLFVRMTNPAVLGDNDLIDESTLVQSARAVRKIRDALDEAAAQYDVNQKDIDNAFTEATDHLYDRGEIKLDALLTILNSNIDWVEDEVGAPALGRFRQAFIRALGYDGIVDAKVSERFKGMGLNPGDVHYIVFNGTQVKSAIGNRGTYSRKSANITFSLDEEIDMGDFPLPPDEKSLSQMVADDLADLREGRELSADDYRSIGADWRNLSANPEAFNYPISDATELDDVVRDMAGEEPTVRSVKISDDDRLYYSGTGFKPARVHVIDLGGDSPAAKVYEDLNGRLALNVANFKQGTNRGALVYQMVGTWAANSGRKLIGDPAGLSNRALFRRTVNMFSNALRTGSTAHLEPHAYQTEAGLEWRKGDDDFNVGQMAVWIRDTLVAYDPDLYFARDPAAARDRRASGYRPTAGLDSRTVTGGARTLGQIAVTDELLAGVVGVEGGADGEGAGVRPRVRADGADVRELVGRALYSIAGDSKRDYTAAQRAMFERTGRDVKKPNLEERMRELRKDFWARMRQGIFDQFDPIKAISSKAYTLMRLSRGSSGAVEALLKHGMLDVEDDVTVGRNDGGFIERVGAALQGEVDDFLWWIASNRAEQLSAEERERLFTKDDIAAGKSLASGEMKADYVLQHGPKKGSTTRDRAEAYADALKTYNEFSRNVLDIAQKSGLIDGDSRQYWERGFYVPFYRESEERGFIGANIKNGAVRQKAFERLKGGKQKLNNDLLTNVLMNWAHLIDASAKNRAALAAAEAAVDAGEAIESTETAIREMGRTLERRDQTFWVMDGGRKRYFLVEDARMMAAFVGLEFSGMRGPIMDALSNMKHWLTIGVTASPAFKMRNLIRDSVQAIAVSDLSYNPVANVMQGYKAGDRKGDLYVNALASGALIRFGTMVEGSQSARVRQLMKQGMKSSHLLDSESKLRLFWDKVAEPALTAYNELGNRGEEINRMALYEQLLKQGVGKAEAALMARDLMDFSMQGTFTTVRFLTQIVPFLNARLQGLYKLGRGAAENPKKAGVILASTALASLALLAAYHDDPEWKKREDWDRDNYWWFKFAGVAYRIPKPFEIGAVATLAERGAELFFDPEQTKGQTMKQVMNLLSNQLSFSIVPQAVKPILDVYSNKDSFTGRRIETMSDEKLRKDYRFDSGTSMVARGIGTAGQAAMRGVGLESIGWNFLSPKQIDHMVRGYTAWLGSTIVASTDIILRPVTGQVDRPDPDHWRKYSMGFISSLPSDQSKYVTRVYDQLEVLEDAYGTYRKLAKEGRTAEAREFFEENRDSIRQYRDAQAVKSSLTKLSQQIKMIERSNLDGAEKRKRISEIKQRMDAVSRRLKP